MEDCFRGSSLTCLLWLVNVCLFIAYLNVFHAVYFLFCPPPQMCVKLFNKPCDQSVSQAHLYVYSLTQRPEVNGTQSAQHGGLSYHRVDW